MRSIRLMDYSGADLARLISKKALSPVEITLAYLERIDHYNSRLNCYITVCRDDALAAARVAEEVVMKGGYLGPLHGLPLAVKDQFETKMVLTTAGSRSLGANMPAEDATSIARAKAAGAILLGKLNMTQFASGHLDPYQYCDPARNPWDQKRDPLGSSSGSGIAIAASLCAISLGEDTGGSIRAPSSANGIVGLRPTWGRVSRHGILPASWSMDTGGPMTRTVEDVAIVMNAIAGYDPKDRLTSKLPVPNYTAVLTTDLRGVRVGIIQEFTYSTSVDPEVSHAVTAAARTLKELGANVKEVSLPLLDLAGTIFAPITLSDAAFVHQNQLRNRPHEYGRGLRMRLMTGSLIPHQVVQKANRMRALVGREWLQLFRNFDVLVSPTLMYRVKEIRYAKPIRTREEAKAQFSATTTAALAGTPAMSLPCGFDSNHMPIGLQIMGSHFQEEMVLKVGYAFEKSTSWHTKRPSL